MMLATSKHVFKIKTCHNLLKSFVLIFYFYLFYFYHEQIWSKKIMNRIHNIKKKVTKGAKKLLYQSDDDAVVEVKCGRKKAQSPTSTIPAIPDGETDDTLHEQKKRLKGVVFKRVT